MTTELLRVPRARFRSVRKLADGVVQFISPYDIPETIAESTVSPDRTRFDFGYVDGNESLVKVNMPEGIIAYVGQESGRVFRIERPESFPVRSITRILFHSLKKKAKTSRADWDNLVTVSKVIRDMPFIRTDRSDSVR